MLDKSKLPMPPENTFWRVADAENGTKHNLVIVYLISEETQEALDSSGAFVKDIVFGMRRILERYVDQKTKESILGDYR